MMGASREFSRAAVPVWGFHVVGRKNTGVDSHSLLQGTFRTQRLNLGLLHYRQTLYHLSHKGSLIFPSGCEGKLGVALESLQGKADCPSGVCRLYLPI